MDRSSAPHKRTATALTSSSSSPLHWWSRIPVRINKNKTRAVLIIIIIHWIYNEKCQTNNNHELLIIPVPCAVCRIRYVQYRGYCIWWRPRPRPDWLTDWGLRPETCLALIILHVAVASLASSSSSSQAVAAIDHGVSIKVILSRPERVSAVYVAQRQMKSFCPRSLLPSPPSSSPTSPHSPPPVHVSSNTTAAICWALGTCLIEWRLRSLLLLSHPRPSSPEPSRVLLLIDNFDWHTTTIHHPILKTSMRCNDDEGNLIVHRSIDRSPFPVHCCCCFSCCGPVLPPPLMANDLQCHYQHTSKDEKKKLIEVAPPSTPCHFVVVKELFIISCNDRIDRNQSSRGLERCSFVH